MRKLLPATRFFRVFRNSWHTKAAPRPGATSRPCGHTARAITSFNGKRLFQRNNVTAPCTGNMHRSSNRNNICSPGHSLAHTCTHTLLGVDMRSKGVPTLDKGMRCRRVKIMPLPPANGSWHEHRNRIATRSHGSRAAPGACRSPPRAHSHGCVSTARMTSEWHAPHRGMMLAIHLHIQDSLQCFSRTWQA
jgi:hypothetical protein